MNNKSINYKKIIDEQSFYHFKKAINPKKIDEIKKKMILIMKQFTEIDSSLSLDKQLDHAFKNSCKYGTNLRSNIYKAISNLQEIYSLYNNKNVKKIISSLGIKSARQQGTALFAMEPNENKFLTDVHQDIRNNFCSMKAINLWFPLSKGDVRSGGLGIFSGSHKLGPHKHKVSSKTGYITIDKKETLSKFPLKKINKFEIGDIIIFSPFSFHFSLKNTSKNIRWTASMCIDDAANTPHFRNQFNPYERSEYVEMLSNEALHNKKN